MLSATKLCQREVLLMVALIAIAPISCSQSPGTLPSTVASHGAGGEPNTPKTADKPADSKPILSVSAEDYYEEWAKNEAEAFVKYKGRTIELEGTIAYFSPDNNQPGWSVVTLASKHELKTVPCHFHEQAPWTKISVCQKVKIKGEGPGFEILGPGLNNCVFVDLQAAPTTVLTSQQLAKEYSMDKKGTIAKYDGKLLVLTGEVLSKDIGDLHSFVTLRSDNGIKVSCAIAYAKQATLDAIKPGDQIKLLGGFHEFAQGEKSTGLGACYIIK
jgi:tRNA_anti-like